MCCVRVNGTSPGKIPMYILMTLANKLPSIRDSLYPFRVLTKVFLQEKKVFTKTATAIITIITQIKGKWIYRYIVVFSTNRSLFDVLRTSQSLADVLRLSARLSLTDTAGTVFNLMVLSLVQNSSIAQGLLISLPSAETAASSHSVTAERFIDTATLPAEDLPTQNRNKQVSRSHWTEWYERGQPCQAAVHHTTLDVEKAD